MKTSISTSRDPINRGSRYAVFISDFDLVKVGGLFSKQEKASFKKLGAGTMAEQLLALTMMVYALEQDKEWTETEKYLEMVVANDTKTGDKDSD